MITKHEWECLSEYNRKRVVSKMTDELELKIIKILQERGIKINLDLISGIHHPKETEEYILFGYDGQIQIKKEDK